MAPRYTQDQAAAIFRQFSDGDPNFTLYYPDGTPADALNTGTEDFGSYSVGPSDRDTLIKDPWAPTKDNPGYSGYLHPIDAAPDVGWHIPSFLMAGGSIPWGWLALGAAVVILAPAIIAPVPERQERRVAGDSAPGDRRRRSRRR